MTTNGFFVIDKPLNVGSTDCVRVLRKLLNQRRVGHSGTLDFLATGVLVICAGKATKLIEYMQYSKKTYITELQFGEETNTLDKEGVVINSTDRKVNKKDIEDVLEKFKGEITQIPPMYSALKKDGVRLYELARRGETVDRKSRNVTIYDLELLDFNYEKQIAKLKATVSAGTYIRTLGDDIGKALNNYAHLSSLRRIECSGFTIDKAVKLNDLNVNNIMDYLYPLESAVGNFDSFIVKEDEKKRLLNGMTVNINSDFTSENIAIFNECKTLVGIGRIFKTEKGYMLKLKKHLYLDENN